MGSCWQIYLILCKLAARKPVGGFPLAKNCVKHGWLESRKMLSGSCGACTARRNSETSWWQSSPVLFLMSGVLSLLSSWKTNYSINSFVWISRWMSRSFVLSFERTFGQNCSFNFNLILFLVIDLNTSKTWNKLRIGISVYSPIFSDLLFYSIVERVDGVGRRQCKKKNHRRLDLMDLRQG